MDFQCGPEDLKKVGLAWFIHGLLDVWFGKNSKTKSASLFEFIARASWALISGILARVKRKNKDE
jgi:hypothetical protein